MRKNTSSRFRGVSWHKAFRKWFAQISIDGKKKTIGSYDDETEAARAYDATVRAQSLDKPLNFQDDLSTAPGVYVPPKKKRVGSSRFRGVHCKKTGGKWHAKISIAGKSTAIGSYDEEMEAARAYDATVRAQRLARPLNFPNDLSTAPGVFVPKKKRVATSRFRGVCWNRKERMWRAKIRIAGAPKYIGTYDDETEAARAYDSVIRAQNLDQSLNFPGDLSTAPGVYVPKKKKKRVGSSRFRGVSWDKTNQKWKAQVFISGKQKTIGSYDDETEAARAYDATGRAQSLDRPLNFLDDLHRVRNFPNGHSSALSYDASTDVARVISSLPFADGGAAEVPMPSPRHTGGESSAPSSAHGEKEEQSAGDGHQVDGAAASVKTRWVMAASKKTSRYRGVYWSMLYAQWCTRIDRIASMHNVSGPPIGNEPDMTLYFDDETDAARAYDRRTMLKPNTTSNDFNFPNSLSYGAAADVARVIASLPSADRTAAELPMPSSRHMGGRICG